MFTGNEWQWKLDRLVMRHVYVGTGFSIRLRGRWFMGLFAFWVLALLAIALSATTDSVTRCDWFTELVPTEQTDIWRGLTVVALTIWLFGTVFVAWWSDFIRWFFNPLLHLGEYVRQDRSPRLLPALTGLFERTLFTFLSIVLLRPVSGNATALITLIGAYIALRALRRDLGDSEDGVAINRPTSLHAVWNIGVSLGIAAASGWLFWRVPYACVM